MNPSDGIYIDTISKEYTGFSHHSMFSLKAADNQEQFQRSESQTRAWIPDKIYNITVGMESVSPLAKELLVGRD